MAGITTSVRWFSGMPAVKSSRGSGWMRVDSAINRYMSAATTSDAGQAIKASASQVVQSSPARG